MDSTSATTALQNGLAATTGTGSPHLSAQASRFAALMQQPTNQQGGTVFPLAASDRYTDEVAPQQNGPRPVTIPEDVIKLGQGVSDELRAAQTRFDSITKNITDPYLLEVREGIKAAVQFQEMNARLRATMKAVELSTQGFSQLFKMQG